MKQKIEQGIQKKIMDYISSIGGIPFKQNQIGIYAQSGVPDILCCIQGRFIAIEVKQPGKVPKPHQQSFLDAINKCGGIAFSATNIDEVKQGLLQLKKN